MPSERAIGPAQLGVKLALTDRDTPSGERSAQATLTLDGPLKGRASLTAMLAQSAIHDLDGDALLRSEARIDAALSSEPGTPLLALLGLDRALAPGRRPDSGLKAARPAPGRSRGG